MSIIATLVYAIIKRLF